MKKLKDKIICPRGKEITLMCAQGYLHPFNWFDKKDCCQQVINMGGELPICDCPWARVFQIFAKAGDLR